MNINLMDNFVICDNKCSKHVIKKGLNEVKGTTEIKFLQRIFIKVAHKIKFQK